MSDSEDNTVSAAEPKASRPWYKKKRFMIPLGILVLLIAVGVGSGGSDSPTTSSSTSSSTADDSSEAGTDSETESTASSEEAVEEEAEETFENETVGEENARESAKGYLSFSGFSRTGLIDQLLFEGYSQEEAEYGVDAQGADWNEQAARSAARPQHVNDGDRIVR